MGDVRHLDRSGPEFTAAVHAAAADLVLLMTRTYEAAPRVSVSQLRTLLLLNATTAVNITALAAELGASPSSASRLCDRLAAAGLVERVVNPTYRREVTVRLTADGKRLVDEIETARSRDLADVLAAMSATGRQQLLDGLHELSRAMGSAGRVTAEDVDHNHA